MSPELWLGRLGVGFIKTQQCFAAKRQGILVRLQSHPQSYLLYPVASSLNKVRIKSGQILAFLGPVWCLQSQHDVCYITTLTLYPVGSPEMRAQGQSMETAGHAAVWFLCRGVEPLLWWVSRHAPGGGNGGESPTRAISG